MKPKNPKRVGVHVGYTIPHQKRDDFASTQRRYLTAIRKALEAQ